MNDEKLKVEWWKDEKLKYRSLNTYNFSNHDINKFVLLLGNGIYQYECMDGWEKFSETSLLKKKIFTVT